jgi:hypothetical protein
LNFFDPNVLAFFPVLPIVTFPEKKKKNFFSRERSSRDASREERGRDRQAEAGGRRESRSIRT